MTILYLILGIICSYCFFNFIKKYSIYLYISSVLLSIFTVYMVWTDKAWDIPEPFGTLFYGLALGGLGVSLIYIVMFAGALPDKCEFRKRIIKIRAELSIIGSILILGHNISFSKYYVPDIFISPDRMWPSVVFAAYISCILVILMLILFITSFKIVRSKIKASNWKKIQKLAYPFLILIYFHVMAIFGTAFEFNWYTLMTIVVYTLMYVVYVYFKLLKEKNILIAIIGVLVILIGGFLTAKLGLQADKKWSSLSREINVDVKTDAKLEENYIDGKYIGLAKGKVDDIKVEVEIKDRQIVRIEIIENKEQEDEEQDWKALYWATNAILTKVIKNQNLEVGDVVGAKDTGRGIKEAIKNALEQAK